MKQILRSKILRKVLTLVFLFAGLVFVASTDSGIQAVKASECCTDCALQRAECYEGCNDPNIYYPGCFTTCNNGYNYCRATCDPGC